MVGQCFDGFGQVCEYVGVDVVGLIGQIQCGMEFQQIVWCFLSGFDCVIGEFGLWLVKQLLYLGVVGVKWVQYCQGCLGLGVVFDQYGGVKGFVVVCFYYWIDQCDVVVEMVGLVVGIQCSIVVKYFIDVKVVFIFGVVQQIKVDIVWFVLCVVVIQVECFDKGVVLFWQYFDVNKLNQYEKNIFLMGKY